MLSDTILAFDSIARKYNELATVCLKAANRT